MGSAQSVALYLALLVTTFPRAHAWAAPPSAVEWQAPSGCPTAQAFEELLAGSRQDSSDLSIRGRVTRNADGFELELDVSSASQRFSRTLRATDCESLAESAVWLIELAAVQLASTPDLEPQLGAAQGSAGERVVLADRASLSTEEATSSVYLDQSAPTITHDRVTGGDRQDEHAAKLGLQASLGLGIAGTGLTGAAPMLSAALDAHRGHLRASLRAGTVLHSTLELESARITFQSAFVGLAACHDLRRGWLRTGPCALIEGWLTFVDERGLREGRAHAAPWLNAGGAWHVRFELQPALQLSLELGVSAGLSPRPSFAVSGVSRSQVAPVAGYARFSYGLALW